MIIGLDIETTGLDCMKNRIIELCLGIHADDGKVLKYVTMRFNPKQPIDPKSQAVHHITFEELINEPTFDTKAAQIGALLGKADLIVIHNAQFDAPFLKVELERFGVKAPHIPVYDTMTQSRWATPDGKWPRLGELCWALDVDYDPNAAHAADYDVKCMMDCFFETEKLGFFSGNVEAFDEIKPSER